MSSAKRLTISMVVFGLLMGGMLWTFNTSQILTAPVVAAEPGVSEYTLVVEAKEIVLLDKPEKKTTVWAYGLEGEEATVPGPVLRVKSGDILRVHFKNTHTLPHTIHFHGVHPLEMDGNGVTALGETQLQLGGEEYTYEFVAGAPGIYFYHCHTDTRNHVDHGMYGLLIIEDPDAPEVDQEFLTIWDDWDVDGDGEYETHTINSQSFPMATIFSAKVGQRVRMVFANIGWQVHAPHMHGVVWDVVNPGDFNDILYRDPNGVITIGPGEIKVVEYTLTLAGAWLFHCHVVPHVEDNGIYPRGMLGIVAVEE